MIFLIENEKNDGILSTFFKHSRSALSNRKTRVIARFLTVHCVLLVPVTLRAKIRTCEPRYYYYRYCTYSTGNWVPGTVDGTYLVVSGKSLLIRATVATCTVGSRRRTECEWRVSGTGTNSCTSSTYPKQST